jgi:hypothetical protein
MQIKYELLTTRNAHICDEPLGSEKLHGEFTRLVNKSLKYIDFISAAANLDGGRAKTDPVIS